MKQSKRGNWKRLSVVGYWGMEDNYKEFLEYWNWNPVDIHGLTPSNVLDRITPIIEYYNSSEEENSFKTTEEREKTNLFRFSMETLQNICLTLDELYGESIKNIFMYCDEYVSHDEDVIRHNFSTDKTNPENIYGCFMFSGKCVVQVSHEVSETGVNIISGNFY
jgi:hypothetical protein